MLLTGSGVLPKYGVILVVRLVVLAVPLLVLTVTWPLLMSLQLLVPRQRADVLGEHCNRVELMIRYFVRSR